MTSVVDDAIALLERTPLGLSDLVDGLPVSWLTDGNQAEWSVHSVVGHLISGEVDDWIPRLRQIIDGLGDRPFAPFDREAHLLRDANEPLARLLATFSAMRRQNVEFLQSCVLDEDALARTGRHPTLGTVTTAQLIAASATHDLDHLAQIVTRLARTQEDAVGPWKEYLGILEQ